MRTCGALEWVLALLAVAAPTLGQQVPPAKRDRRPMVGTVVGSNERPIEGASVVVAHVPPGHDSLPAHHHATATTDARGRFRLDVLSGVDYRVFAIGPPDEHGTRFVSEVHETTASVLLTLRATTPMPVRTFRLEHAERWREFAPLRLRVLPGGAELPGYEQSVGDDGSVVLPSLPTGYATFEVLTAGGVLATMTLRSTGDVVMQATPVWDVPIELVDDAGKPVAGAEVQQHLTSSGWSAPGLLPDPSLRQTRRPLGTSDASGRLVARVPRADDPFGGQPGNGLLLVAAAPDHHAAAGGACGRLFEGDATRAAGDEARCLRLTMLKATPPRVRLHWGGEPEAGIRLVACGSITVRAGRSTEQLPWLDVATTDENGHATFATLPAAVGTAWLTSSAAPAAARDLFPGHAPPPRLLLPTLEARHNAVLDVNLATFRRLHLRVLGHGNAPAQTARLVIAPPDGAPAPVDAEFPMDPTGQWTALAPPGPWCAFAAAGDDFTLTTLAEGGLQPQVLQLSAMRQFRGRIVDARGVGIDGAESQPLELRFEGPPDHGPMMRALLVTAMRRKPAVRTAADGTFLMQIQDLPGCVPYVCFQVRGARTDSVSAYDDVPIELVIPGR